MASKDVFFYLSAMLGTFFVGAIIGLFILLASYVLLIVFLNLLPKNSPLYGFILTFIDTVKMIIGQFIVRFCYKY
jgi:hypothetical protein